MTVIRRYVRAKAADLEAALPPSAADDVAQETVLRAWSRRGSFDGSSRLETWFIGIARNVLLESIRGHDAEGRWLEAGDDVLDALAGLDPEVADLVSDRLMAQRARAIMAGLSDLERRVLQGKFQRGHTFRELASELRVSENTIKSKYYRALKFISTRIGGADAAD